MKHYDTVYHRADDLRLFGSPQIGDTPNCVYLTIDKGDVWDLLRSIVDHLQLTPKEDYEIAIPCTLRRCDLYGSDLPQGTKDVENQCHKN